jgi:hypothetical protein
MCQTRTRVELLMLFVIVVLVSSKCGSTPSPNEYRGTIYYAGDNGIWKMTLPDKEISLVADVRITTGLNLSPDRKWLTYYDSISRDGEWLSSLWVVSVQGGEPIQVSDDVPWIASSWEDEWLRYTELSDFHTDPDKGYAVPSHSATYVFNPETKERRLESEIGSPPEPAVAQPGDCQRLAIAPANHDDAVEKCLDAEGSGFLRVINLDGTNPITIPVHFKDGAVAWSNDGEWLAFGGGESQPGMPRPFLWSRRSDDIWQVGSETTQSDYIFSDPVWSPDNQWLAFNSSNESLCVVEVENGDIKCFKGYLSAIGTAPEWSPDSRAIIVASNRIGKLVMGDADLIWDLFIISVPDGAVTRITDDSSESKGELWPIWVP